MVWIRIQISPIPSNCFRISFWNISVDYPSNAISRHILGSGFLIIHTPCSLFCLCHQVSGLLLSLEHFHFSNSLPLSAKVALTRKVFPSHSESSRRGRLSPAFEKPQSSSYDAALVMPPSSWAPPFGDGNKDISSSPFPPERRFVLCSQMPMCFR